MKKYIKIGKYTIKIWIFSILLVSIIASGVIANHVIQTLTIKVDIGEPLEILSFPTELNLYPNEREEFNVTLINHASANYSVTLTCSLSDTSYQENYVTFSDETFIVDSGEQNLTVWLEVDSYAPSINTSLIVDVQRIAGDEFNSKTLSSDWSVVDPTESSTFELNSKSGYLTISTTASSDVDLMGGVNFNAPRILQSVEGDFTVETKIWAVTTDNIQSAGIVLWIDENNFLRLERAQRYDNQEILFIGTIDGDWSMSSAESSNPGEVLQITTINPTFLKLERKDNVFYGYYSKDGQNWNLITSIELDVENSTQIGLYVVNRLSYGSSSFLASFDYFRLS
ncbi:MAG: DUF1349 domain-containing protein [Candidatus Bathyarchaeota archaeon]|nr:DUF1349 domain-containing protein [Candidatus Bathyarchaeum sp.]